MYESFYKLNADPFLMSPDHRFAFAHGDYAQALSYLEYGLIRGEGIVVVSGAPGTGKSTLVEDLLAGKQGRNLEVARLVTTALEVGELLRMVAFSFGIEPGSTDKASVLMAIQQYFQGQYARGRSVLLIVDEAQHLSAEGLEELRQLTNIQNRNKLRFQLFLLGQPGLDELINGVDMEQLRQRIIAYCQLEPLSLAATRDYIGHRLVVAGWCGDPVISGEAVPLIHRFSRGIPRRINQICSRLLLHGFAEGKHRLEGGDVREVLTQLATEMMERSILAELASMEASGLENSGETQAEVPQDIAMAVAESSSKQSSGDSGLERGHAQRERGQDTAEAIPPLNVVSAAGMNSPPGPNQRAGDTSPETTGPVWRPPGADDSTVLSIPESAPEPEPEPESISVATTTVCEKRPANEVAGAGTESAVASEATDGIQRVPRRFVKRGAAFAVTALVVVGLGIAYLYQNDLFPLAGSRAPELETTQLNRGPALAEREQGGGATMQQAEGQRPDEMPQPTLLPEPEALPGPQEFRQPDELEEPGDLQDPGELHKPDEIPEDFAARDQPESTDSNSQLHFPEQADVTAPAAEDLASNSGPDRAIGQDPVDAVQAGVSQDALEAALPPVTSGADSPDRVQVAADIVANVPGPDEGSVPGLSPFSPEDTAAPMQTEGPEQPAASVLPSEIAVAENPRQNEVTELPQEPEGVYIDSGVSREGGRDVISTALELALLPHADQVVRQSEGVLAIVPRGVSDAGAVDLEALKRSVDGIGFVLRNFEGVAVEVLPGEGGSTTGAKPGSGMKGTVKLVVSRFRKSGLNAVQLTEAGEVVYSSSGETGGITEPGIGLLIVPMP